MQDIYTYIDDHQQELVGDLIRLCKQPSVSAQRVGLQEMAKLLRDYMSGLGIDTQLMPTKTGVPVAYGTLPSAESARTLLFYNHFDVQPVDPLDKWTAPPFEPDIRDGHVYARGATDNKGNIISRMAAVKAFLAVHGRVPVNLKFLIEGEEEIGSPGLADFIEQHTDMLQSDACVWEDTMGRINAPVVSLGSKGMCHVELRCKVARIDSHSSYAGIYPNAVWRLVWALATIKDENERVLIDGFYDSVRALSEDEEAIVENLPRTDVDELRNIRGLDRLLLDLTGSEVHRRQTLEPTCNIGGIVSGYYGEGSKSVVPAEAVARIDFRLVPDQDPHSVAQLLKDHLLRHDFDDIEVTLLSASYPSRTPVSNPLNEAISVASTGVYGLEPIFEPHQAGSTPQWVIDRYLKIPCSATGVGYVTCMSHAPDENIRIDHLVNGAKYMATIMSEFGRT